MEAGAGELVVELGREWVWEDGHGDIVLVHTPVGTWRLNRILRICSCNPAVATGLFAGEISPSRI